MPSLTGTDRHTHSAALQPAAMSLAVKVTYAGLTVLSGSTLAELRTTLEAALGTSSPLTISCGQPIETDADLSLLMLSLRREVQRLVHPARATRGCNIKQLT